MLTPPRLFLATAAVAIAVVSLSSGCANFRRLKADLKQIDCDYRIRLIIENADEWKSPVRAAVVEWKRDTNEVFSGDQVELPKGGNVIFLVKNPINQYLMAYADTNRSGRHESGEPLWIHSLPGGSPQPVVYPAGEHRVTVRGRLSPGRLPAGLREAVDRFLAGRTVAEAISRRGVRFALGELADLDDPRFAATRGEDGLWTPATMAISQGFGIYFLEPYDPARTPVLFVHGAAGSPQDWRAAMKHLDRRHYQCWFYFYPSGGRLENAAEALNQGVIALQDRYGFPRLDIVAHSMGGLVARQFVDKNIQTNDSKYVKSLITFSTPWAGHEAAAMGVKWAPSVVPSWRDMEAGSAYLSHLFDRQLKGKVPHHLIYGHRAKRSLLMSGENDGTVSVASQLRKEATDDAASIQGYDEDHLSILHAGAPLSRLEKLLEAAAP
jgi:pimeloyl-ACP methyl ester carboxylesterase